MPFRRDGIVKTEFKETLKQSTYLVALLVSDFRCVEGIAAAGIEHQLPVRVCARPNVPLSHLTYSLEVAKGVIEFYEKLFEIPYPLPKQDNIALPDFQLGGMENWGMICYRESRLIFIEGETSQSIQQSITTVIAHEISHMWFGDIGKNSFYLKNLYLM